MQPKRLFRSAIDRKVCGVCGGLGEYLNVDPTIIRLIWVVLCVPTFSMALVAYVVAALVIPEEAS